MTVCIHLPSRLRFPSSAAQSLILDDELHPFRGEARAAR
jgi:hypothetical protein